MCIRYESGNKKKKNFFIIHLNRGVLKHFFGVGGFQYFYYYVFQMYLFDETIINFIVLDKLTRVI
jgi:hypothetical protein